MSHGAYRKLILSSAMLATALPCMASINNGDFENWSGNSPNGWSTIDTGITLSASNTIVNSGALAAKVVVNTASQSYTD